MTRFLSNVIGDSFVTDTESHVICGRRSASHTGHVAERRGYRLLLFRSPPGRFTDPD
jgi:hypothetical protein